MPVNGAAILAAAGVAVAVTTALGPLAGVAFFVILALLLAMFEFARVRRGEQSPASWNNAETGRALLDAELARSRRYERSLVLMRLQIPSEETARSDYLATLAQAKRATDSIWLESGALYIVMPESGGSDADGLVERIRRSIGVSLDRRELSIAVFPDDTFSGMGLIDLVNRRAAQKQHVPPPFPIDPVSRVSGTDAAS